MRSKKFWGNVFLLLFRLLSDAFCVTITIDETDKLSAHRVFTVEVREIEYAKQKYDDQVQVRGWENG